MAVAPVLRDYQTCSVNAALDARLRGVLRPLIVLPTGAGKSLVLAEIARRVAADGGRVLIVTHVRELVEQDAAACDSIGLDVGIYSAGLDRRDIDHAVVVAGIQSAYDKAELFGARTVLLIDEAHRCRADGDGQYHQLIRGLREQNESITMIGLTATPYRTQSGMLTDGDPPLFDEVSYCAEIPDLISQGFLCPLRSKQAAQPSMAGVKVVAGDWSDGELGEVMAEHVAANCADLVKRAANCTRTLIFGCTIDHCQQIATALHVHGWAAPVITGSTPDAERDYLTRSIRSGEIRALINCQVLTTGFDAPGIDCVAIMRPTKSAGLYYQMAGRGFRIAEGKDFCTICDYGGNILRHGPLDRLRIKKNKGDMIGLAPMKACPECQEVLPLAARECLCGWVADPIEAKTAAVASEAPIIGVDEARELSVQTWQAIRHMSKAGTTTLRVDHEISFFKHISEWVCFEHTGYPRLKAEEWWLRHGGKNIPTTVDEALRRFGELRHPASIFVAKDGKYDRIMRRTFPRSETLR